MDSDASITMRRTAADLPQVGTTKTCKLRYNMTKAHEKLYVWSESELVDVKTPEIEQGEGGEPGILVR